MALMEALEDTGGNLVFRGKPVESHLSMQTCVTDIGREVLMGLETKK